MTLNQVMRRIRWAYFTMLFSALATLVMIIASIGGILKFDMTLWEMVDSALALTLAVFIHLKSRAAAVIAVIYFLSCRILFAIEMPKNIGVWLGFSLLYFLFEGARASFEYHKKYKQKGFTITSSYAPPWVFKVLNRIPLVYFVALPLLAAGVALMLIILALLSYTDPLPMPRTLYIFVTAILCLVIGISMFLRSELMREVLLAILSILCVLSILGLIGSPFYEERHIAYTCFGISLVTVSLSLLLLRILTTREVVEKTTIVYMQKDPDEPESP